jgi:hypothetical protein
LIKVGWLSFLVGILYLKIITFLLKILTAIDYIYMQSHYNEFQLQNM